MNEWKRKLASVCLCLLLAVPLATTGGTEAGKRVKTEPVAIHAAVSDRTDGKDASWIIKWKTEPDPAFAESSFIITEYEAARTVVARPAEGADAGEWLARWERSPAVQYVVANRKVGAAAAEPATNDPFLDKQSYLKQTHTIEAWSQVTSGDSIVIAVIDTGVDMTHPDLKDNLVPGVNLVQPDFPPRDDNGHGTNVAGIIAALGHNGAGVAGMLWKARIMPIKALEPSGRGDEDKLGEGIRYAVDQGAKIVVMSVGLLRNDSYLQEIVQYAEDHDVLLIAASGNDEGRNIRYPAAYPTVMAVGGVKEDNGVEPRANYGPELDLVAPWAVFTTAMGGKYEYRDGTSMAAPQVAAAAAMVWAKSPHLKAYEVRSLLRQTATDIGAPGWDELTGYGLLNVEQALAAPYNPDMYEPNNQRTDAKPYTAGRMISAELKDGADEDWYRIDAPYDGTLTVQLTSDAAAPSAVRLAQVSAAGVTLSSETVNGAVSLKVRKGRNWIVLRYANAKETMSWTYRMSSSFAIYADPFEDNDRQYKAFKLSPRSQSVTGTFHRESDEDWYAMTFEQSGLVTVKATPDTKRIDPVLTVQKKGERAITFDENEDGEVETYTFEAFPGTYYFKVGKVSSAPTVGEYKLEFRYEPKYIDPNEPNDRSYQATVVSMDTAYEGVFDRSSDVDYYKFSLPERSLVRLQVTDIPEDRKVSAHLQNSGLGLIASTSNAAGTDRLAVDIPLSPGTYYVRLGTSDGFQDRMYHLTVHADPLVAGFIDVADHWAKYAIVGLTERQIVEGYGNFTYRPDRPITRAEAVAMAVKGFGYTKRKQIAFTDVAAEHWAYDAVSKAAQAGIVQGYPDGSFDPDGRLTRVEMAVLFAKALGLGGKLRGDDPFPDIDSGYWAVSILKQMKAEGWISGYDDGTFRPDEPTTRAEYASLMYRVLNR